MNITTIDIDLAKNVLQGQGVDRGGRPVLKKSFKRDQVLAYFSNFQPCLIGMKACGIPHFWAGQLQGFAHTAKSMAPTFVKPYVKANKNDAADAETICVAARRPSMRTVTPISLALVLAVGIAVSIEARPTHAQHTDGNYPAKPIRLIVPWVGGGGTDIVTRIIAQKFSTNIAQQVVVDNRPGANGIIGAEIAAKATPDGYTIILHSVEHVINAGVYEKLPYDTIKSFAPLTLVGTHYLILVVNPSSPTKSVSELTARAKANPGQLTFGSWGTASLSHLSGELFKLMGKTDMTHVPYKGAPQAAADIMAGRISFMFTTPPTSLSTIRAGKLLALGVTSPKRLPILPDTPTMNEAGYQGFEVESWKGMFVPANTPKSIINRLHDEFVKVVQSDDIRQRLTTAGFDAVTSTPEQLDAFSREQALKWSKVAKDAHVQM